jgi:hypothetical protein
MYPCCNCYDGEANQRGEKHENAQLLTDWDPHPHHICVSSRWNPLSRMGRAMWCGKRGEDEGGRRVSRLAERLKDSGGDGAVEECLRLREVHASFLAACGGICSSVRRMFRVGKICSGGELWVRGAVAGSRRPRCSGCSLRAQGSRQRKGRASATEDNAGGEHERPWAGACKERTSAQLWGSRGGRPGCFDLEWEDRSAGDGARTTTGSSQRWHRRRRRRRHGGDTRKPAPANACTAVTTARLVACRLQLSPGRSPRPPHTVPRPTPGRSLRQGAACCAVQLDPISKSHTFSAAETRRTPPTGTTRSPSEPARCPLYHPLPPQRGGRLAGARRPSFLGDRAQQDSDPEHALINPAQGTTSIGTEPKLRDSRPVCLLGPRMSVV